MSRQTGTRWEWRDVADPAAVPEKDILISGLINGLRQSSAAGAAELAKQIIANIEDKGFEAELLNIAKMAKEAAVEGVDTIANQSAEENLNMLVEVAKGAAQDTIKFTKFQGEAA